ncbi:MAG: hypothetical protein R3195_14135 [Gemmatimonadota bacterium]|nr:hypothetical protein [Gemmatimonadota bacterium]
MTVVLAVLVVTTLLVSVLIGRLAKLSVKELATQTLFMLTAAMVFFGLVAMLPAPH